MSQTDDNKAIFYRWFNEAWNAGKFEVAHEIISPKMQVHGAGGQPVEMGPDGLIGLISTWRNAFPDGHMSVDGLIAEGDLVAALLTWHGTHQGEFYGAPPSGKSVVCTSIGIDRINDGIVTAGWGELDMLGMMQQMGVMPMVGPGSTATGRSAEWGADSSAPADAHADPEANKAVLTRFLDAVNAGDADAARALVDEAHYVEHNPSWGVSDAAGSLAFTRTLRAAMPDLRFTYDPQMLMAEGDKVAAHGLVTGTHTGADLYGAPASGKQLVWSHTDLARISGGKIVERWISADNLSALQQAGVLPGAGG